MGIFSSLFGNNEELKKEIQQIASRAVGSYQRGDYESASIYFSQFLKRKPIGKFPEMDKNDHLMLYNLGNCQHFLNNIDNAITIYSNSIKINSTLSIAFLMRSVCYFKKGKIELAKNDWYKSAQLGNERAQEPFESITEFIENLKMQIGKPSKVRIID